MNENAMHVPQNNYKEFPFEVCVSSEEVVQKMEEESYVPANAHELSLWDGWDRKGLVVALGSVMGDNRNVPFLSWDGLGPNFDSFSWNNNWPPGCRFLGVRKL